MVLSPRKEQLVARVRLLPSSAPEPPRSITAPVYRREDGRMKD